MHLVGESGFRRGFIIYLTAGLLALSASLVVGSRPAHAADLVFNVNSILDVGDSAPNGLACNHGAGTPPCTLRSAIQNANFAAAGNATVNVPNNLGQYSLHSSLPPITAAGRTITFNGNAQNNALVFGTQLYTAFNVVGATTTVVVTGITLFDEYDGAGPAVINAGTLTLNNMTLRDNLSDTSLGAGAIQNSGTLTINNSTFQNNVGTIGGSSAGGGGGIRSTAGTVTLNTVTMTGNQIFGGSSGDLAGGAIAASNTVLTINNSTITGNSVSKDAGAAGTSSGGAIWSSGTGSLTITGTTISGNSVAANGGSAIAGAIFLSGHGATLTNVTLTGNRASSSGGTAGATGIYTVAPAPLTISSSVISGNSTTAGGGAFGGGVYVTDVLTMTNSTVSGNSLSGSGIVIGGGVIVEGPGASTVSGSTISGNGSAGVLAGGGLMEIGPGTVTLTNDTLSGNTAGSGGALYNTVAAANVVVQSTTIGPNTAATAGPGIYGPATLKDTIIAAGSTSCAGGPNVSQGNNLETGNSCTLSGPGDKPSQASALLGPLAANGGATQTQALLPGSPAIDAGAGCTASDQRGMSRSGPCDIGAYEYQYTVPTGSYRPLTPYRVLDTRPANGGSGPLGPGSTIDVQITGTGGGSGVPASGVGAVAVNVTAVGPTGSSFLAVYPTGALFPAVSSLNFGAGQTIANLVEVPVGFGGAIRIFNSVNYVDVVVDVQGWYTDVPQANTNGLFVSLPAPQRIMDTRPGAGNVGPYNTPFGPDTTRTLTVTGSAPLPPAGKASAAVLNVTAVSPSTGTFLTAFPTGATRPNASNVNVPVSRNLPNRVIVGIGTAGQVSFYNSAGLVDVVIDIVGWFTNGTDPAQSGGYYHALGPQRILDTRAATQIGPYNTPFGPATTRAVPVAGQGNLPASGIQAVVGNLTGVGASTGTFLTAFPSDAASRPTASDLNLGPGDTIPNLAIVKLGADGKINVYNDQGTVDVLLDTSGFYG